MKRLFRLFPVFALLTGVWACSDDKTSEVRINDGTEFLSLDYLARSGKITVTAPGPWSITLPEEGGGKRLVHTLAPERTGGLLGDRGHA